ncbi:PilZ domain-containing protein [bacterium]|nr:PilZ domain-containing protein [candidate division CSSED10-310 bacterium]
MARVNNDQIVIGIEFLKLTHWDRYILNENIAILERKLFPESRKQKENENEDIWRGNRRRHYRLDTSDFHLEMLLDFRPSILRCFKAKVLNISPSGCCLLLPSGETVHESARIPKVQIQFGREVVSCRARVVHIYNSIKETQKSAGH